LAHCHAANVVHRDVKPDNFLLGGNSGQEIKLTDFGLATILPPKKKLHGIAGTAPYMSPELLGSDGYDDKTDVWSLGVTAYVMLFGVFPYMPKERSGDAMKAIIRKGSPAPSFKPVVPGLELPADAIEFAKALLNRNKARIAMQEVPTLKFVAPSEGSSGTASKELTSTLKMAKALTQEFRQHADPTVQRSLDELLQRLQIHQSGTGLFDNSDAAPTWFSETQQRTTCTVESIGSSSDTISSVASVVRRKSRHSTHSGVPLTGVSFRDDSDDDTIGSTRPPTPQEEALPPLPQVIGVGNGTCRSVH
jgi:serine/threonine protein kinase